MQAIDLYIWREGQTEGPYSSLEVRKKIWEQALQPSDFGWREGFDDWKPLSEIPGLIVPEVPQAPSTASVPEPSGSRRKRSMIGYLRFAGFRLRWVARLVDSMLIFLVCTPLDFFIANQWMGGAHAFTKFGAFHIPPQLYLVNLAFSWVYFATFEASPMQGTLGKRLLNLRVTDPSGERPSLLRTLVRYPSKILSAISIIGYPMVLWTRHKRALHDFIAGTYVIREL